MLPADLFADQPVLTGAQLRLEQLGPAVAEDYWAFLGDPEGRRLTGTHATFTRESVDGYLASRPGQPDRADWAAVRLSDGAFLGEVVLNDLDADNASVGFRIALAGPHVFGRGYGTEMTRLVLDHAFAVGLHRVSLEVYAFNPRAQRVYEKCGFRLEGRLRESLHWEGAWHDTLVMSVLSTDPRD